VVLTVPQGVQGSNLFRSDRTIMPAPASPLIFAISWHSLIARSLREGQCMAAVTIRNLSDEVHRALKHRAVQHNRSTEAEMRAILEAAVRPEGRLRIGTAMAEASQKIGLTNADIEALEQVLEQVRDRRLAEPMRFE
jgi:plasmid stability protein